MAPFDGCRQPRAQAARRAQRIDAPRVEGRRRTTTKYEQLDHRKQRRRAIWFMRDRPLERARPPPVQFDRVDDGIHRFAPGDDLLYARGTLLDARSDRVPIRIGERQRIHDGDAGREAVALHQVQHRRFRHAVDADAAKRELCHREIERERRSDEMPGTAARFHTGDVPHAPHARVPPRQGIAEVVAVRGIARDQDGSLGIAEVEGVRQRQQRGAEQIVDDRNEMRARSFCLRQVGGTLDPTDRLGRFPERAKHRRVGGSFSRSQFGRRRRQLRRGVSSVVQLERLTRQRLGQRGEAEHRIEPRLLLAGACPSETLQLGTAGINGIALSFPFNATLRTCRWCPRSGLQQRVVVDRAGREHRPQLAAKPGGHRPVVASVVVQFHRDEIAHESLACRRVDSANGGQPCEEGERSLKLRERREATSRVEGREALGLMRRCRVDRRCPDAHAFEREHQHGKRSETADGHGDVGFVDRLPGKGAVREREEVEPPVALPRRMNEDHFRQRDRVCGRLGRCLTCGRRVERTGFAEDALPEGRRPPARGLAVGCRRIPQPREERRELRLWPDERRGGDVPLGKRAARERRQAFQRGFLPGTAGAERLRQLRRIKVRQHVVQVRQPSTVAIEQRRHETFRAIEFLSDDRFPRRRGRVAATAALRARCGFAGSRRMPRTSQARGWPAGPGAACGRQRTARSRRPCRRGRSTSAPRFGQRESRRQASLD